MLSSEKGRPLLNRILCIVCQACCAALLFSQLSLFTFARKPLLPPESMKVLVMLWRTTKERYAAWVMCSPCVRRIRQWYCAVSSAITSIEATKATSEPALSFPNVSSQKCLILLPKSLQRFKSIKIQSEIQWSTGGAFCSSVALVRTLGEFMNVYVWG